jgi:hypothetical protein
MDQGSFFGELMDGMIQPSSVTLAKNSSSQSKDMA